MQDCIHAQADLPADAAEPRCAREKTGLWSHSDAMKAGVGLMTDSREFI